MHTRVDKADCPGVALIIHPVAYDHLQTWEGDPWTYSTSENQNLVLAPMPGSCPLRDCHFQATGSTSRIPATKAMCVAVSKMSTFANARQKTGKEQGPDARPSSHRSQHGEEGPCPHPDLQHGFGREAVCHVSGCTLKSSTSAASRREVRTLLNHGAEAGVAVKQKVFLPPMFVIVYPRKNALHTHALCLSTNLKGQNPPQLPIQWPIFY